MIGNTFFLNGWKVDVSSGRISRGDVNMRLEPQVMKVLSYLVSHADTVVTREELFTRLWGHSYVGDAALTRCIFEIRRAFGDDPRNPTIIETVPKIGFRLIADLKVPRKPSALTRPVVLWTVAASLFLAIFLTSAGHRYLQSPAIETYNKALAHLLIRTRVSNQNAIVMFEKSIALDPDFGLAHAGLANAISQQTIYWGGKGIDDAYAAATTALRLAPNAPQSHNAIGLVQHVRGDQSAALSSFKAALQLDPGYIDATYNTADVYRRRLEFRKAVDLYLEVVKRAPDHIGAKSHLGFLYLRMGELDNARKWIERVISDHPMESYANSQLATLEMVAGNTAAAVEICEKVQDLYPTHKACLHVLGSGNLKLGNHDEALRWFNYEIDAYEDDDYARLGIAQIFMATDRDNHGLAIVDDMLHRTNDLANAPTASWMEAWTMAACFALKGDTDRAIDWLNKAAEAGRRFHLWDAEDSVFSALHGDVRFQQYISMTRLSSNDPI